MKRGLPIIYVIMLSVAFLIGSKSVVLGQDTDILTFSLDVHLGTPDNITHTVAVTVPYGTDLTNIQTNFTLSPGATGATMGGSSISDGDNLDFSSLSETITVSNPAGTPTDQDWTINVTVDPNTETDILTFSLDAHTGTPNATNHTVAVTVPYGTDLSAIATNFTLSGGASADFGGSGITSGDPWNFTSLSEVMTITADDGSTTQDWTINVTVTANTETDILTFSLDTHTGTPNATNHTVAVAVPFGTDLSAIATNFTLSGGASADFGGSGITSGDPWDFTSLSEVMTITADDGSTTQDWTINVTVAANTETDILTFSLDTHTGTPNATNHTVAVAIPFGTDLSAIATNFTLSDGASADFGGSGITSGDPWDFTSLSEVMTITADDGSTTQDWTINVTVTDNTENDILSYSLPGQTGPASINIGNHTVNVEVPFGTDVGSLIAVFSLSPQASATVGGLNQESGTTANDFTNPVTYVVEAGDGTPQNWEVTVSYAANTETDILTYSVGGFNGTVNSGSHTVNVSVPYGTVVNNMIATFTLSNQAEARVSGGLQESGVSSLDFSTPVSYEITAGDGTTTQNWLITVTVAQNTETDFITYSFPEQTQSTIDATNHTIDIEVQYGTDISNLVATFSLSPGATTRIGATPQTSSLTVNDFTNPLTYIVTADDGTTVQNWSVTVTEALNFATDILDYSIPNQLGLSTINDITHTVEVVMPFNTNVNNLVASFNLSDGASASVGAVPQNSGVTANNFSSDVTYTILAENGTDTEDWTITVTVAPNTSTSILLFSFDESSAPSIIDENNHTVDVVLVYGTDMLDLVANFTLSPNATATIGGVTQQSGTTANDFTNPVTYTITAQDGTTTQDWIVSVVEGQNTEADILAYSFDEQTNPAVIDSINKEIYIEVAYNTDVSDLVASFTLSDNATAKVGVTEQTSGVTSNNFTNEVTYVITSEDGVTALPWIVIVSVASNTNTDILTFSFPAPTDTVIINSTTHEIEVTIEYGTDLTNLIAIYTLSTDASAFIGPVRQESGVSANDFSSDVIYSILAGDGVTSQDWIISVGYNEPVTETDILNFTFDEQLGTTFKDTVNNILSLYVQPDTQLDRLIAIFELSHGATAYIDTVVQESGVTVNDFTDSLVYIVVAQDGISRQNWTIIVRTGFTFEYVESPDEFPVSNTTITASARLPSYQDIEEVIFYYRKFENEGWESMIISGNQEIFSVDISREMVGNLGMYYYFNAVDTTGSNLSLDHIQLILHYDTDYPAIPNLRFGETVNHYQIISVPLNLQNTNVEAVFDELGEYDIKYWRLFHHNGISTNEYRNGFTNIDPGLGYWLIVREPTSITTGEGRTVRIDSVTGFQMNLDPGWNQIGNPYDMDINWDAVIINNQNLNIGRVKLFNQDILTEGNMIPSYRGGFVFLEGVQPITVNLEPSTIRAGRMQQYVNPDRLNSLDENSWIAGLKLSNGVVSHNLSGIGMHPEAVEGKDRYDEVLLPVPKEIIPFELAFNHPDEQYKKFSMDVIQTTDEYIWEFEVKSYGSAQALTLTWDNRHFGNNEYNLILNHKGAEKLVDMKDIKSYTFNATGNDQFRIIFGDDSFISNELKPKNITLGQGYPNPFRDELTIPFSLPEGEFKYLVNISVYDLTGNMVKQLTNEDYDPGYYTVKWNSLDEVGVIGRGIYLIRMVMNANGKSIILTKKAIRY